MRSHLLRLLSAFLLFFTLSLPFAAGQSDISVERGVKIDPATGEKSSGSPAVFPYFVLIVYIMLIMTIVCMPSRRA